MKKDGQLELAYMAGLFDGEGCILISKRRLNYMKSPFYYLRVKLGTTNPSPAELFRSHFGGSIIRRYPKPNKKKLFDWQLCCIKAESCLKELLPFLRLKKEEAELGIEFQDRKSNHGCGGRKLSSGELAWRESYKITMQDLKKRSY